MSDQPFTTHGDEALEARTVSWVLGEASAFESAELERLCEERPELMVFRRRMRALHGLLTEAEKQQPDEGWKLPGEKRRALDELFGEPAPVRLEAERDRRVKHSGRRALLAIAACVALTLVVLSLMPGQYEAAATIEIKPRNHGMSPMAEATGAKRMTPQVFGTEFEKIKSRNILEKVVENLGLESRWAVDRETALKRLRDRIKTRNIRGTDLIEIRAREKDPDLARDIAGEVSENYQAYRRDIEQRDAQRQLAELGRAVRDQEDKVEERRKVLATIVRTKGTIYRGQDSLHEQSDAEGDQGAKPALQAYRELEQEKSQLQSQLDGLDEGRGEQRMVFAFDSNFPENKVRTLYPQYIEAKRELDEKRINGLGDDHPEVVAADDRITKIGKDLNEEVERIRAVTNAELNLTDNRLDSIAKMREDTKEEAIKKGLDARDYVDAWREFENDRQLLQQMKLKLTGEQISSRIPSGTVEVCDQPVVKATTNPVRAAAEKLGGLFAGKDTAVAARESAESATYQASGKPLETPVPREPIEGTPRPTNAPNPETPVDGPAGYSSWSMARRGQAAPAAGEVARQAAMERPQTPAPPAASVTAGVKTASGSSSVPVPRAEAKDASLAFGRGDGFGSGWGGKDDAIKPGGLPEEMPEVAAAPASRTLAGVASGIRSGDGGDRRRRADAALDRLQPARSEPAIADGHEGKVDDIRRNLHTAEGNYNLGKFDDAKRDYENVLRTDPHNSAARRGLERLAAAKSDYYRAAYDHTRAELLAQVDQAWELAVSQKEEAGKTQTTLDRLEIADSVTSVSESHGTALELPQQQQAMLTAEPAILPEAGEIPATEEPFSTFSLNIGDASFRIARAALAKGERPDPAGVRVEQFYNAVDYGDPAPANGEPVALSIGQAAHPVIPGRNLVRIALKTAAAGRAAGQPLRLTLLVDQSGSMSREDRRAAMDRALEGLSGLLTENDLVSVIGFARTPRLLADAMAGDRAKTLAQLVNQGASEGGTNLEQAIHLAGQIAERIKHDGARNRIVLFTDGAANLGNADPAKLAGQVRALRQKGIAFDIAGIAADGLNDELLGELARHGNGRYYIVGKGGDDPEFAGQLAGAFRPAAENVKVQVRFNPERVARYKLIGFEKDRLKTGDFRNDAVDAAELAAEEAGVAIYQIEPIPGGSGEIGEVSVRFRDTAAAAMVERSWTIPHDADAPAIDRAPPSMQLATLAMLAAEKLRGGPLAQAIDFKRLAGVSASVKQNYGNTGRPAEVLRMVDALK